MRTQKRSVPQIKDKEAWQAAIEELKSTPPGQDAPPIPDPSTAVKTSDPGDISCELDEYAAFVKELRSSGIIKDHWSGLSRHKNSFSGRAFVDWVVETKQVDRERAVDMGQALIDRFFGHQVKAETTFQDADIYYRLLEDDDTHALNAGPSDSGELGEDLRKLILKIYSSYLSADGRKVNYKGIGDSSEFEHYVRLTKELVRVQIAEATRDEKLAFFINVYNALVIHANVTMGPPVNLWQRYKFFNTVKYIIGGQQYSLQDIENGVLRANRRGMGMILKPFGSSDPRLKVALSEPEPLIHFALVCGAKSCPPIKTYSADGITEQLRLAAEAFLDGDDGCQVDMAKKTIKLTQILKWYSVDFGNNKKEVVKWVCEHMGEGDKRSQVNELMSGGKYSVSYMPYDWGINA
ncbi:DPTOR-like protein [Mya arenaria]|uniref:DPTOR-like protein n=1 Tax=Mya arenaria TaxID=6604 RepID=A0ABY7FP32_MYAAR|nr:DPTOR-like protein [Mya arenaria]